MPLPPPQITVICTSYRMTATGLVPDLANCISNFEVTYVLTQNVFVPDLHWAHPASYSIISGG
jgi:hypothetical protein